MLEKSVRTEGKNSFHCEKNLGIKPLCEDDIPVNALDFESKPFNGTQGSPTAPNGMYRPEISDEIKQ